MEREKPGSPLASNKQLLESSFQRGSGERKRGRQLSPWIPRPTLGTELLPELRDLRVPRDSRWESQAPEDGWTPQMRGLGGQRGFPNRDLVDASEEGRRSQPSSSGPPVVGPAQGSREGVSH